MRTSRPTGTTASSCERRCRTTPSTTIWTTRRHSAYIRRVETTLHTAVEGTEHVEDRTESLPEKDTGLICCPKPARRTQSTCWRPGRHILVTESGAARLTYLGLVAFREVQLRVVVQDDGSLPDKQETLETILREGWRCERPAVLQPG